MAARKVRNKKSIYIKWAECYRLWFRGETANNCVRRRLGWYKQMIRWNADVCWHLIVYWHITRNRMLLVGLSEVYWCLNDDGQVFCTDVSKLAQLLMANSVRLRIEKNILVTAI